MLGWLTEAIYIRQNITSAGFGSPGASIAINVVLNNQIV